MSKNLYSGISGLILASGSDGIFQSELEKKLGCSKSRVSEVVKRLLDEGRVVRKHASGRNYVIWDCKFFPGYIKGTIRIGMLPSTEYLVHIAAIRDYSENVGSRIVPLLYENSSNLLDDLSIGKIEIGFAPLTSFLLHSGVSHFKIISEVASGGSSICLNEVATNNLILTSEYSSMAVMTAIFIKSKPEVESRMMYSLKQAVEDFCNAKFRYISIWEPYLTELKTKGFNKYALTYEDSMDDSTCCALGVSNKYIENDGGFQDLINIIRKKGKSFLKSKGRIDQEAKLFSNMLSLPEDLILKSISSYRFKFGVSASGLRKVANLTGISITKEKIDNLIY